jgi:hypothetical protein
LLNLPNQIKRLVILLMYATSIFILNTWDRIFNEAV